MSGRRCVRTLIALIFRLKDVKANSFCLKDVVRYCVIKTMSEMSYYTFRQSARKHCTSNHTMLHVQTNISLLCMCMKNKTTKSLQKCKKILFDNY